MSGGMITTDVSGKADTVLTTKGDIATWDTKRVRKGVSATNYTGLQADSAIADGLTYGATSRSTLTTTGDMLAASAANTLTRIAGGASGEVLTGNGAGVLPTFQAAAGGGAWSVIGNYTATATDTSKTFSSLAVDFDDYSEVCVVCDMANTANSDVQIQINGVTSSSYFTDGWQVKDGTDTIIDRNSQSSMLIMPTALGQNNEWTCINHIQLSDVGHDQYPNMNTFGRGEGLNGGSYMVTSALRTTESNIDSVKIESASSTFQVGSRITVYKVARA